MIRRNTWIVLAIFVILLASVLFWQQTKQRREGSEPVPTLSSQLIMDLGEAKIVGITMHDNEGNVVKLELDQEGLWQLKRPNVGDATDSSAVETAITQLMATTSSTLLDPTISLQDLGLDKPRKVILLILDDGGQFIWNVGKLTPTGSGYYVLTSDRKIFVAGQYNLDSFLGLLTNLPIVATPTPTATLTPEATAEGTPVDSEATPETTPTP